MGLFGSKNDKDVCPKCWHEGCKGNCESLQDRRERENREQVRQTAERMRRQRRGR